MERLTTWRSDKRAAIANNDGATRTQQMMKIPKVIDRLAAIEDILGDEYDLDRLRELVEADRDGRCVVLLSNDDVYTIRGDIVNGIIKANCRDACKPPKSALKGDQHEQNL